MKKFLAGVKDTVFSIEGIAALLTIVVVIGVLDALNFGPERVESEVRRLIPARS